MYKTITYFFILILVPILGYSQDWITLATPQSGILGAPVKDITRDGEINLDYSLIYDRNPSVDTRESAESIKEYQDKFRSFATKYFNTEKVSLQTVTANNLKVRSLSQASVNKLQVGAKYIYEGLTADSVTITLSAKREISTDISKAIKDISSSLTGAQAVMIVEKAAPFVDSIKYSKNDSIYYKVTIKNPNVYYKVKVIKLKRPGNPCKCDWETNCFLYFTDEVGEDFPRTIVLRTGFADGNNSTISRYPEFCGRRDDKSVQYSLKLIQEQDGLHLWVHEMQGSLNNAMLPKFEVPYKDIISSDNTNREWRLERTFLHRFRRGKVIKSAFIEVSARQLDKSSIEILNWKEGTNSTGQNALTSLRYPEFKADYVYK